MNGNRPLGGVALAIALAAACGEAPPPADGSDGDDAAQAAEPSTTEAGTADRDADLGLQLVADDFVVHPGDAIPWGEAGDAMRYAALYGNSGDEGRSFVFRLDVDAGFELGPHTHPITEHMTVLSGTFMVGVGETLDRDAATAYGPGSYLAIAAGVPAYMWVEEPTVVQVHGVGPLTTQFITPEG